MGALPVPSCRVILALAVTGLLAGGAAARGQTDDLEPELSEVLSPAAERFRALGDPESEASRERAKRQRPRFEFFRTQVAPSEVIPYAKAGHWATLSLEMRANHADYAGNLQTVPVTLSGMPHRIIFRREARLLAEQEARLSMQVFLPELQRLRTEMDLELIRPDAVRGDGLTQALLQRTLPHQMLIPVLGPEASSYAPWSRFQAFLPASGDRDPASAERQRYYRLVDSQDPDRPPPLSAHPLSWTTISHLIWDGQNPEGLGLGQQQALRDWLHWGGQLVIIAGAGRSIAPLQESFLEPYLPATLSGQDAVLEPADLKALATQYPAPFWPATDEGDLEPGPSDPPAQATRARPGGTVYLTGLAPKPGATPIALDEPEGPLLGVEWRVGRGRVLILALRPTEPALMAWPGLDTLVRRVVLRRPVERPGREGFRVLSGPEVTWVRFIGRDLGIPIETAPSRSESPRLDGELPIPTTPVGAWIDGAELPVRCREALETASGLTIPPSRFVLTILIAYIVTLVPVNWLVCRFVLRRPEWAWVAAPLLSLGFAVLVERAAAHDMGFDTACDEIDLIEIQGSYPRAHVSRFASLYTTGRHAFTIAYPGDPTALALPMNMGPQRYQRGEDLADSVFQSSPFPALLDLPVQPRSLTMFRAEQMADLPGGITLHDKGRSRQVINRTGLDLHDAMVIDATRQRRYLLGTLRPGVEVALGEPVASDARGPASGNPGWIDPAPFLERLLDHSFQRPEDRGEWRLVAWTPDAQPGQDLRPGVDRHRAIRLVIAHLEYGPPPRPDEPPMIGPSLIERPDADEAAWTDPRPVSGPRLASGRPGWPRRQPSEPGRP